MGNQFDVRKGLETSGKNTGIEIGKELSRELSAQLESPQIQAEFGTKTGSAILSNGLEVGLFKLGMSLETCIIIAAALRSRSTCT